MRTTSNIDYETLCSLLHRNTLIMERDALTVFQPYDLQHSSIEQYTASTVRNLTQFYLYLLKHEFWQDYLDTLWYYFTNLGPIDIVTEFQRKPFTKESAIRYLKFMEKLPPPKQKLPEPYHFIYGMIRQILHICDLPEEQQVIQLYQIAILWDQKILHISIPAKELLSKAEAFQYQHKSRRRESQKYSIQWGLEYDSYLQKYLKQGYRMKTAKTAARKDFIAAHPLNDDSARCPGHSNPALKRYHKAYLDSIT